MLEEVQVPLKYVLKYGSLTKREGVGGSTVSTKICVKARVTDEKRVLKEKQSPLNCV